MVVSAVFAADPGVLRTPDATMATWQADYHVVLPAGGLPSDYRQLVGSLLPPMKSWHTELEMWGTDDGDRIDVSLDDTAPPEILARFDLRHWNPELYAAFLAFVREIGGRLRTAEEGEDVGLTTDEFSKSLRESEAAQFVRDPEAYLRSLAKQREGRQEP